MGSQKLVVNPVVDVIQLVECLLDQFCNLEAGKPVYRRVDSQEPLMLQALSGRIRV